MRHNYSRLLIFLYYFSLFLLGFLLLFVFSFITGDFRIFSKNILPMCIIACFTIAYDKKLRTNRYVEFFDEYVHFNSLSIKHKRESYNLNIRYEDIYEIKVKKCFIVGLFSIYIKADNFGYEIPLNCFYSHHKDMYAKLYHKIKHTNPYAIIDNRLTDFLERKNLI